MKVGHDRQPTARCSNAWVNTDEAALVADAARPHPARLSKALYPVSGLAIAATLERPATTGEERELAFVERETGVYEARVDALGAGSWILTFVGEKPRPGSNPAIYRGKERLWLRQVQ